MSKVRPASQSKLRRRSPVASILRQLGQAIQQLEVPAMEKIADGNVDEAFRVLVGTMLSAQTKDAAVSYTHLTLPTILLV